MPDPSDNALREVVKRHWGYESLRPLQLEAMTAAQLGRDALVVLPTGGGKSLCYQAPAVLAAKPTVVVSPLIALMKDQVDGLIGRNIPAAYLNSSLNHADRRRVSEGISQGKYKLIFVAPERLAADGFLDLLSQAGVGGFAVDEAHCISHWGHDFRADYRQLGQLKQRFPGTAVHTFTATATPQVRRDIIDQLGLSDPVVLAGDFFRPNLTYRVQRRGPGFSDVHRAVRQRSEQAGIIYCIRRDDVDQLTAELNAQGIEAVGYHAGKGDEQRSRIQEAFSNRRVNVIVATVAFGMGIDRADIRYVIHAAMPKSIEHYQQETGRAGRDGLPAECLLFFSGADFKLWQYFIGSNDSDGGNSQEQTRMLSQMYSFCTGMHCRHRKLVTYFGQPWERDACGACDFCNDGAEPLPDSTVLSQKIMSCVARTGQRFGAAHVTDVLLGSVTERVAQRGHDQLSTFGLLRDRPKPVVMQWIDQLVDQDLLIREAEFRTLTITEQGWQVLRSKADARLYEVAYSQRPAKRRRPAAGRSRQSEPSMADQPHEATAPRPLDAEQQVLFERLRVLRREIADEMNVPAFFVFADRTLRAIVRARPASQAQMLAVKGVGPAKYESFGERFIRAIRDAAPTC